MSAAEFAAELVKLISQAEDDLTNTVRSHQNRVLRRVLSLLNNLDLRDGKVKATRDNRRRIQSIRRAANTLINSENFYEDIKSFTGVFETLQTVSYSYFTDSFDKFNPSALYEDLRKASQNETIQSITVSGTNEGLTKPIESMLQQATRGGASLRDLRKMLKDEISTQFEQKDGEEAIKTKGKLEKYTNLYVRDSLNQFSRNLTKAVTESVGLEWYLYSGGRVKDTRDFCKSRLGKYWHESEVEAWGKLGDWQGKRPGTNSTTIYQNLGGYNCLHQLIPVSEFIVPKSALNRIKT